MTPILVDDPFLALGMTVNFPPWERFFDFPFRSYSCFRKKIRLTCQKVFPLLTVGAPSASNSPSAPSARAGSYIAFITSGPRCFGTQRNGKTNQRIIVRGLQIPCGEFTSFLEVNLFTLVLINIYIFFFSETGSVLACEFSISSNFSLFPDSNSTAQQFDLNVNKTYIIMAQGLLDDNMTFMWDNFAFFTNGALFSSFLFYTFQAAW